MYEEVLCYDKLEDFHLEIIEKLRETEKPENMYALFLLPRGHWKSTLITVAYTIQRILRNPDISIFISNATLGNAGAFCREIKNHFEKNEKLIELFGNWVGPKWGEQEFIVGPRKSPHKEPTLRVGSPEHSVVSSHFDLIIHDDLANRENTGTKEQCDKVIQYYKDCLALRKENKTMFLVVMTVWHYNDVSQFILSENKKTNRFVVLQKSCWKDEEKRIPLFSKFSAKDLLSLKAQMGSYDFSKQYENKIIDDASATFRWSMMQRKYSDLSLQEKTLNTFIAIDAAMSKEKGSDFTGVMVVSVDPQHNWYIRLAKRYKVNTMELVNLLFDLWTNPFWKRDGLQNIGVEQNAFKYLIRPMIKEEGEKRGLFPNIVELKHGGSKKEDRIRGALQGRFENEKVFFHENPKDDTDYLVEELLKFPFAKNDDLMDALSYVQDLVFAPRENERRVKSKDEEEMFRLRKIQKRLTPTVLERI